MLKTVDKRIGYLDGFRGLAIILVMAGHFFSDIYPFQIGWIGLNLFFVLSGYLITGRLYMHCNNTAGLYFLNFYTRRALRIFPLYYGCLLFFFVFLPFFYSNYFELYGSVYAQQGWYWTFTSNWMMISKGLPEVSVFFHFWSLAVEEQFYLVWPLLFLILFRSGFLQTGIIILIAVAIILRCQLFTSNMQSYLSTFTAMEPLLLGALVAVYHKSNFLDKVYLRFRYIALVSFLSLVAILINNPDLNITNNGLFYAGYSAINVLWVFVLISCIREKGKLIFLNHLFRNKILQWLGKYSYGIYVFHWIVLNPFIYKFVKDITAEGVREEIAYFFVRITGILLVLSISYLSYHFIEKPFLKFKKYFS